MAKHSESGVKRKPDQEDNDEFQVEGTLNIASDSESEEEVDDDEPDQDTNKRDDLSDEEAESEDNNDDEDDEADSEEAELNRLLAEEEGADSESEFESDSDAVSEPETITDKISGVQIQAASQADEIHTSYSDGRPRVLKPEIEPVYDLDDSDAENFNTIGNVPLSAYDEMPHIGYNINGKRIMRPARGSALQQLLDQIELPEGWTGLVDQNTGKPLQILPEELELIRKIQHNENTDSTIDPYAPTVEWFTSKTEVMPLLAAPEPKRRFQPSKHEARMVMKLVRAIREGKIVPGLKKGDQDDDDSENAYDLWATAPEPRADDLANLRAPKLAPPTHEESYNPPEEYLLNKDEEADHEGLVPKKYQALRSVPAYGESIKERFDRCLDLYLAPRTIREKAEIDPESLVPQLPLPRDLRPFPVRCSTEYRGHHGRVRTLAVDPRGIWLATGGDDGTVKVWEVMTGREVWNYQACDVQENADERVDAVAWNPDANTPILAVAAAERILLVVPPLFGYDLENAAREKIEAGWGFAKGGNKARDGKVDLADENEPNDGKDAATVASAVSAASWISPSQKEAESGIGAIVELKKPVRQLSWHRRGDYFVTVAPEANNSAVLIHQLSKHLTQLPFRKSKGIVVAASFHPLRPQLIVATQRTVRIYDLAAQQLVKKLMPGARMLATLDVHPRGDHLLLGSYDKRVLWHDLDMGSTPYKNLRFHDKAVRAVAYHRGRLPLFASGADDGSVHVFHGAVYDDYMTNPLLVPLKKLQAHEVKSNVGVLALTWHPAHPWLFTCGADGVGRLWTT